MTAQHPDILTVRDAEILRRLRRVVDAGEYYKSFTADDVTRVAAQWLTPREAQIVPLRVVRDVTPEPIEVAEVQPGAPTVAVTRGQYAIVAELCRGGKRTNIGIGLAVGTTDQVVKAQLARVYKATGCHNRTRLAALIRGGHVQIVIKPDRKKAS